MRCLIEVFFQQKVKFLCINNYFRKGDRYDGDWHMDMRHGDGDMKYMDGTVYEVSFIIVHVCSVPFVRLQQ